MNNRAHDANPNVEEYDFMNGNHLIVRFDPLETFTQYSQGQISAKLRNLPVWAVQCVLADQPFQVGFEIRYDAPICNQEGLLGHVDDEGILNHHLASGGMELMPMLKMTTQKEEVYFYSDTLFCIRSHGDELDFIGELS